MDSTSEYDPSRDAEAWAGPTTAGLCRGRCGRRARAIFCGDHRIDRRASLHVASPPRALYTHPSCSCSLTIVSSCLSSLSLHCSRSPGEDLWHGRAGAVRGRPHRAPACHLVCKRPLSSRSHHQSAWSCALARSALHAAATGRGCCWRRNAIAAAAAAADRRICHPAMFPFIFFFFHEYAEKLCIIIILKRKNLQQREAKKVTLTDKSTTVANEKSIYT